MDIYHVTRPFEVDTSAHKCLIANNLIKYSFLVAANELEFRCNNTQSKPRIILMRNACKSLILDSGVLGAAKKGKIEWIKNGVDRVSWWGGRIQADRIAHVDIPSEPHILKMLGLTIDEARKITIENARLSLENNQLDGKRIISVQGWTLDDRQRCLDKLMPIIENDKDAWIGNGSTCMLTPKTGLYKFYEWICSELPDRHIHAWGIANPLWLANLYNIGISSADSGTAGFANGMNEEINPITGKRTKKGWLGKRNSFISSLGFIKNMEAIEQSFSIMIGNDLEYKKNGKSNQLRIEL